MTCSVTRLFTTWKQYGRTVECYPLFVPGYNPMDWGKFAASLRKNNESVFSNERDFTNVQNLIGVSSDEIRAYIRKKEDKKEDSVKKTEIKKAFSHRLLGKLTVIELKKVLEKFNVSYTRQQNNRADILKLVDKELENRNLKEDNFFE